MRKAALALLLSVAVAAPVAVAQFNPAAIEAQNPPRRTAAKTNPTSKAAKVRQLQTRRAALIRQLADVDAELAALGVQPADATSQPALKDGGELMLLSVKEVKERYGLSASLKAKDASADTGIHEIWRIDDPANHRYFLVVVTGDRKIHEFTEHEQP